MSKLPERADGLADVTLHIYDLLENVAAQGVNSFLAAVGAGAFHAGVEVHGIEWSFAAAGAGDKPDDSGIFHCPPKGCSGHHYRDSLSMGKTARSAQDVAKILDIMGQEWKGGKYDLLRKNCCHFCDAFCQELGVGAIPSWVTTNIAGAGAFLRSSARLVGRSAYSAGVGVGQLVGAIDSPPVPASSSSPEDHGQAMGRQLSRQHTRCVDDGSGGWMKAGDAVEIWSNSTKAWCEGVVESISGGMVLVAFQPPDVAPDEWCRKELPADHNALRKCVREQVAQAPAPQMETQPPRAAYVPPETGHRDTDDPLKPGDRIEVFSNSLQAWCPGWVEAGTVDHVTVAFRWPGTDEPAKKELPRGHKSLRRQVAPAASKEFSVTRTKDPDFVAAPSLVPGEEPLAVGDIVEVFSRSWNAWCPGRVTKLANNTATVSFQAPGGGPADRLEKDIPVDHADIRRLWSPSERPDQLFSSEEKAAYQEAFREITGSSSSTASHQAVAVYIEQSALPRVALKEVWSLAVPRGTAQITFQHFGTICRLIGHCQAMLTVWGPVEAELVECGGETLCWHLEQVCLDVPPPSMPDFHRMGHR